MAFAFGDGDDIRWLRDRLRTRFGRPGPFVALEPIGQLLKSSISSRTYDDISLSAYRRLVAAYPRCSDLAKASAEEIETVIGDVTFPDVKARRLGDMLRIIAARRPNFDLAFLGQSSVQQHLHGWSVCPA